MGVHGGALDSVHPGGDGRRGRPRGRPGRAESVRSCPVVARLDARPRRRRAGALVRARHARPTLDLVLGSAAGTVRRVRAGERRRRRLAARPPGASPRVRHLGAVRTVVRRRSTADRGARSADRPPIDRDRRARPRRVDRVGTPRRAACRAGDRQRSAGRPVRLGGDPRSRVLPAAAGVHCTRPRCRRAARLADRIVGRRGHDRDGAGRIRHARRVDRHRCGSSGGRRDPSADAACAPRRRGARGPRAGRVGTAARRRGAALERDDVASRRVDRRGTHHRRPSGARRRPRGLSHRGDRRRRRPLRTHLRPRSRAPRPRPQRAARRRRHRRTARRRPVRAPRRRVGAGRPARHPSWHAGRHRARRRRDRVLGPATPALPTGRAGSGVLAARRDADRLDTESTPSIDHDRGREQRGSRPSRSRRWL